MSVASISSVTATLIILGVIFSLVLNINAVGESAKDQFDSIQLYLYDTTSGEEVNALMDEIEQIEGVDFVRFESKIDALENLKQQWAQNAYLLEGLEENPLPNSLVVHLTDIYYADAVLSSVQNLQGIEEIKSYQDIVETLLTVTDLLRRAGMIVIFALIAISTFIIHNTIKLAVNARRTEINIMKYVGATNWFIRWPFLAEGTILGLIGAGIAILAVKYGYGHVYNWLVSDFYAMISGYLVQPEVVVSDAIFLFLIIGSGIGALGSIWSMRKYLNV